MSIKYRPATPDDAVLDGTGRAALHRLVAVDDATSQVVGEVSVAPPSNGTCEVFGLYVDPEARRKSIGATLLARAVEVVSAYGATARVDVLPGADSAIALFTRLGWIGNGNTFIEPLADNAGEDLWQLETKVIHAGMPTDELGPVAPPIALSSTYRVTHPGSYGRWPYARTANPTRNALEETLTALDNGAGAGAFASGLAAIDAALRFLESGQRVVVSNDVYGGTWRLLNSVWEKFNLPVQPVDLTDLAATRQALIGASMLIAETPSNPMLRILDIPALADAAHANGALFVVDNTFATPHLQRPLDLGADMVVYSTTKYLGGHSDVIGGALVAKAPEHAVHIKYLQRAVGAVASPFDSYMVLRGIRTISVRMDRHCENALTIARMLQDHDNVSTVYYPGLETDAGYELALKQMRGPGGIVSFRHAGGAVKARRMTQRTKLFTLAESLGAVESLIEVPAAMTHLAAAGSLLEVPDDLVRLSVGIEHVDDLLDDLRQALSD